MLLFTEWLASIWSDNDDGDVDDVDVNMFTQMKWILISARNSRRQPKQPPFNEPMDSLLNISRDRLDPFPICITGNLRSHCPP